MVAIALASKIEQRFGFCFDIDNLSLNQTIASQKQAICNIKNPKQNILVSLRDDKNGPLIVLVPGLGGHVWNYQAFISEFSCSCTIQVISLDAVFSENTGNLSQEKIANTITDEILRLDNNRALWIGGYSMGAIIASTIAQQLQKRKKHISGLLLIDPRLPKKTKWFINFWNMNIIGLFHRIISFFSSNQSEKFETSIKNMKYLQRKTYRKVDISQLNTHVHLLLSDEVQMEYTNSVFDNAFNSVSCDIDSVTGTHVEIMQLPLVAKTAAWMDKIIS